MRKIRIFLLIASTTTVVIGVAASDTNQKNLDHYYYFNGNDCVLVEQTPPCQELCPSLCSCICHEVGFDIYLNIDPNGNCIDKLGHCTN
jgi:hypothetical protein